MKVQSDALLWALPHTMASSAVAFGQHFLALLNRGFDRLDKYYGTELPVFITQGPEKAVISKPRLALCLKTFRQTDLPTRSPLTF